MKKKATGGVRLEKLFRTRDIPHKGGYGLIATQTFITRISAVVSPQG